MAVLSIGQMWAVDDVLNQTWTGKSGTSYSDLDKNAPTSDAHYKGNCAAGNSSVQLRSTNSSGIVSTVSGGKVKKVVVVWNSNTANGRTLDVYGKNTAYSGASNLYNSSSQGTKLGSIVKGTSTTLNISGDYEYIGLRSNSGAMYLTSITITWEVGSTQTCVAPAFNPEAGAVLSGTTVALTTTTSGADIYYTMGAAPADPTTASTKYTAPISITEATTIKAIAVKSGMNNSSVASAAYTILEPKTIEQIMPSLTVEGDEFLLNDVTVTYANGNYTYVKDATGYILVYKSITGAANGKILQGLQGKAKVFNGLPEVSSVTKDPTVTNGTAVEPENLTTYPTNADLNKYVTLEGLTFADDVTFVSTESPANVNGTFMGATLVVRNTFKLNVSLSAEKSYRVIGVIQKYNTSYQIYPISFEEIVEEGAPEAPTFSPVAGTYTEVQNVTISCATEGATIHYTTDGSTPTASSPTYSSAISVGEDMTINAIAIKNDKSSALATAAYTINLPLPSHTFQVTHKFETGEGFVFPEGWTQSYAEHEISYTDDKVVFESANKQPDGATIEDCPVTKGNAISLVLTNSAKVITAVRFDYKQWAAKASVLVMKYSTDGGVNWTACTTSATANFAIHDLSLPEGVNAIQVTGTSGNQIGLKSISFDLDDKPIVTKKVYITAPAVAEGTLVVKNGDDAISSGDDVEVGTTLKIFATPQDGYSLTAISVKDEDNGDVTINENNEFDVPNKNVTVSATFAEILYPATLTLNVQGTESSYPGSHNVGDEIYLPSTATACEGNVFVGWSEVLIATPGAKPTTQYYNKGAKYTLANASQKLYAVYAQGSDATWTLTHEDINSLAEGSGYAAYNGTHEKSTIEFVTSQVMPQSNAIQFQAQAGVLYNTTEMPADIVSIEVDGFDLSVYEGTAAIVEQPEGDAIEKSGDVYPFSAGKRYFYMKKMTKGAGQATTITVNLQPEYSNYTTSCIVPVDIPEPIFDVAAGTYTAEQLVLIENYDGQYIYVYTIDGTEPTVDVNLDPEGTAQLYDENAGIEINASCTLMARAYDIDGNYSDVTTTAYTINLPVILSTIPDIFTAATSTQTEVNISMGNWVVSGVGVGTENNLKTAYVTDGTNGFIIFAENHGFKVGDILSGTIACDLKKYSGAAELVGVTTSTANLTVTAGGTVTPASIAPAQLAGVNTGALISLSGWKYDGEYLTDGTTSIKPWTTLYAFGDAFTGEKYYNVSGIYVQFGSTKEIMPRNAADIEELVLADPEISYTPTSATIEIGQGLPGTVFANPHNLAISYNSNNEAVAKVTNEGLISLEGSTGTAVITASFAGDATYAAANVTYTITVNPIIPSEDVVILTQFNDGVEDKWLAMKHDLTAVEVIYSEGKIYNVSSENQAEIIWKRTIDGDDNVTFQVPDNNNYLKGSTSTSLTVAAGKSGNYQWNWNNTYYRVGTQTRTFLYQGNSAKFKNFAVSNAGGTNDGGYSQLPVVTNPVFAAEPQYTEVRSGLEDGRHYTVCLEKKVVAVKGATFWSLTYKNSENTAAYLVEETAPFEAGKPYIFQATGDNAGKLEVAYEGNAIDDPVENGALRGTFEDMTSSDLNAINVGDNQVYMLFNNVLRPIDVDNHLDAHRAYVLYNLLTVPQTSNFAPGKRVKSMPMQGQTTTGIDALNASETPVKMVLDGQLFILRGEKMYDATGSLVK